MRVRTEYAVEVQGTDDYTIRRTLDAAFTARGLTEYYHRLISFGSAAAAKVFARDVLLLLVEYGGFRFCVSDADKQRIHPQLGTTYDVRYLHRVVGEPTIVEYDDHLEIRCQTEVSGWAWAEKHVDIDGVRYSSPVKVTSDWVPGSEVSMRVCIRTVTSHVID